MKAHLLILCLFCRLSIISAQISGTVTSESGEPLSFATIFILDTSTGTTADMDGEFKIPYTSRKAIVIASYIGYETDTMSWELGKTLQFRLKSSSAILDEVVVSGTMKEVTIMNSPIPIEVYTPVFFRRNPTPNLFTALENVNGVRPQLNCNVCNTGDIHINGMEGPYTMVMIDGMPIVSALSTVYGLMGIPNSMVQRIEVVKGPASTLYGSEAVGGLINVITKNPEQASKLSMDINVTNYQDFNVDIGTRIKL